MTSSLMRAYKVGKRLALVKMAETLSTDPQGESEVDELTKKLDGLLRGHPTSSTGTDIIDSSERSSSATWGDKMELETNSNTGINV